MIYRFLVSQLLGVSAVLCFCASYLTGQMSEIALAEEVGDRKLSVLEKFFQGNWFKQERNISKMCDQS